MPEISRRGILDEYFYSVSWRSRDGACFRAGNRRAEIARRMVGFLSAVYCVAVAQGRKASRGANDAGVSARRIQSCADRALGQELAESFCARVDQCAGPVAARSRFLQIPGGIMGKGSGKSS